MALWDAAAKIAGLPLHRFLARVVGRERNLEADVAAHAGGGYYYPADDLARLSDEIPRLFDQGYTRVKIKIGGAPLAQDLKRIDRALAHLAPDQLAVDAMNAYDLDGALAAATALAPLGLWWFEDICDPLDFDIQGRVASVYAPPIAAGEAIVSLPEAILLDRHGGLRRDRDVSLFDPVHCYGLSGYLGIVDHLERAGWTPSGACGTTTRWGSPRRESSAPSLSRTRSC